ncbi:ABC transporter permease [Mycobacterium sp. E2733]|uniref:ABC transporter permease n=1 Tax=Mycobacterium sp. E2733 TaxID=1834138 RepID=UPI000ACD8EF5|nr:ABC transporter permease [Mycobacterium sp. E2733]
MRVADGSARTSFTVVRDDAFPSVDRRLPESSPRLLAPNTLVQTQRLLIGWLRDPMTFLSGLILPIFFLLIITAVLGQSVASATGHSALHGSVPMVTLIGAMHGASVGALAIITERSDGLLARLWVVPVHRASGLLARISADAVRIVVNSLVLLCIGLLLGLRFERGMLAIVAWLAVPIVFGLGFTALILTVALYWPNSVLVDVIVLVDSLTLFFCTGFVPLDQYPRWIQPVVQHQPLSYAVETMRGLSLGGPVLGPAIGTLLWSGGIAAACAVPMMIGYRRASMRGT